MEIKSVHKFIIALLLLLLTIQSSDANENNTLVPAPYRPWAIELSGANPLGFPGHAGLTYYYIPNATSASFYPLPFNVPMGKVAWAYWNIVWRPVTVEGSIRLVTNIAGQPLPPDPYEASQLATLSEVKWDMSRTEPDSARPDGPIITNQLEQLRVSDQWVYIGMQTKGNGTVGPVIYRSSILIFLGE